jgi:diguanylate cyclase (GGDEF)-like protein/PAS domain S-box-containing protein
VDNQSGNGIRRRVRATDLGSGARDGAAPFNRNAALKEAVALGVCLEDRAQLEALARFAFASPGFEARTTVHIGDDRAAEAVFEVRHSPAGPLVGLVDPDAEVALDPGPDTRDDADHDLAELADLTDLGSTTTSGQPAEVATLIADAAGRSPDLISVFTSNSLVMRWSNDTMRNQLQIPAWAEPPLIELLDDWSQGRFMVRILPALLSRGSWSGQVRMIGPDVAALPVSATFVAASSPTGEISSVTCTAQLVAAPVVGTPRIGDSPFAALVEHATDLIAVIEPTGSIRFASPATTAMLGLAPGALDGTQLLTLIHPGDAVASVAELVQLDDEGVGTPMSLRLQATDGSWSFIEAVVTDLTANPTVAGFVLNARDISERVHAHDILSNFAYTDADTGLPNRLRLLDRVTNLLEDPTGSGLVTVLLIDIDRFRSVNDTYGAPTGDAMLSEIGSRLVDGAGPDALVARLRSDEFAVALAGVGDGNVGERAAEALRVMLAQPFSHNGDVVRITASIGVALGTAGDSADGLLRRADQAAAIAKQEGGNRTVLSDDAASRDDHRRQVVEDRLRRVLDDDDIRVHFQPIVNVKDGTIAGAEALLRMNDDAGALLNPAELIDAAESAGLIVRLGSQIIQVTCEQLSKWGASLRERSPEFISVNISPRQLVDPALAAQVMAALDASAIEPSRLWLEVTESTLIGQDQAIGTRIQFLRDLGVQVGLDEFGAGYSTLSYLRRFPLDFVKIDRSLIAGLGVDDRDTAIVRTTVDLAHTLGLTAVAVGVESPGQLDQLTNLGCDLAQGYLFSPPLAAEDLVTDIGLGLARP